MENLLKMMPLWSYIYMRKVVEEKDFVRRPWRNGKGITHEIMVYPHGEEDFVWRLSMATLGESGPFSVFPGVDRWLVLLEGNPVCLKNSSGPHTLSLFTPFTFSGDEETHSEISSPGKDFNLMLRRGQASGKVSVGHGGKIKVSAKFFGIYSLVNLLIDGTYVKKGNFCYIQDETGSEIHVESTGIFLIIEVNT